MSFFFQESRDVMLILRYYYTTLWNSKTFFLNEIVWHSALQNHVLGSWLPIYRLLSFSHSVDILYIS